MAKAEYQFEGRTVLITNSSASTKIEAGEIVTLTSCICVAGVEIPASGTGMAFLSGAYKMPKATGVAMAVGDKLYYNATNGNITKTNTDVPAGICMEAAASAATSVLVKIG